MTVKEASIRFDLDEKEIRKRQRDNMIIGIRKDGRSVVIPDNTEIIPSKSEVRSFLFQILKKRNNVETIISRSLCPTTSSLKSLLSYLYKRGFIGEYSENVPTDELINSVRLTDDGLSYIFGEKMFTSLNIPISIPLNISCVLLEISDTILRWAIPSLIRTKKPISRHGMNTGYT